MFGHSVGRPPICLFAAVSDLDPDLVEVLPHATQETSILIIQPPTRCYWYVMTGRHYSADRCLLTHYNEEQIAEVKDAYKAVTSDALPIHEQQVRI